MKTIFVDGYNVINSWAELNSIKNNINLESAREKLIEILIDYSEFKGYKIFLVFDAHLIQGNSGEKIKVTKNLIVVYTKESETADSFIEKYVNSIGRKYEVCVVTSDNLEQQVVFQRGSTRMSSIEFYNEVINVKGKISLKAKKIASEKRYNRIEDRLDDNTFKILDKIRKDDKNS
ncbi:MULTISPECIES: NYN domain-containing protein [Clostridium]|uniref:NYN domain-containing protein n=1 Tax=Clostridium TaxID=1485 RepID=UPI00069D3B73|nr:MULTISPECIES: NYN domain-containing protein [Clostridium]KOF55776.1 RNA-binding protein [Clostridium sp. DMHC 10]MCD2347423.1 NYN domain-containing protein [Clostridium guangxiense]